MSVWAERNLPDKLVWIEDTVADRDRSPRGNLSERGQTIGAIAAYYGGLTIATRTLQPPIIRATLRDCGSITDLYVGELGVGAGMVQDARRSGSVPDRRTLLSIRSES